MLAVASTQQGEDPYLRMEALFLSRAAEMGCRGAKFGDSI